MSAVCGILRGSFEDYLRDALPGPQRRMLREHLAACPACRDLAAAREPGLLFARPLREEVPAADAARILASVRTGIELMETERRIRYASRGRRRIAATTAAAAALGALVILMPGGAARPPAEQAPASSAVARPPVPAEASIAPAAYPAEAFGAESTAAGATVYDWNPGAGREEPRVVWIVDRGLDI